MKGLWRKVTKFLTKYKRKGIEIEPAPFVWIDGADGPYFEEGDRVHLRSPYSNVLYCGMDELEFVNPYVYEVTDVELDGQEDVWRYKIKPIGHYEESPDWYSEEWLEVAEKSTIRRQWAPSPNEVDPIKAEIDYWLDTLRHGNADEREQAERRLAELTQKAK